MSNRKRRSAIEEDSDVEDIFPNEQLPPELANELKSREEGDPSREQEAEEFFKEACAAVESEEFQELEEELGIRSVDILPEEFDFPPDPENWKEEDLKEYWADGQPLNEKPGFDPNWVDEDDLEAIQGDIKDGRDPPIAPFYVPYRKPYPVIPHNHFDINSPKSVIEELDRIEEFLTWHSFVFEDGSTYEGTIWDDLAHGKGVYEAEEGLVRYEGEWLQNNPEGHGVLEVDIPTYEPIPGSKLEAEMRAQGHIFKRDYMSPEDKDWLEKDIEDAVRFSRGRAVIPFYENEEWVRQFGQKPEKGRYRYAGQWKHGRMHGCGVFELNERTTYGRFYFGEFLEEEHGCDIDTSALHMGIAEVASAKARMFVNKPDGMVREERGPYNDPQHPYLYEGDDMWMAPGFINQFHEVPDPWKDYIQDVDEERQMWLNSFYKAPLRLPMPAELEYWWENDQAPEFILLNKEPEPDPEDPSKLIRTEEPVILHTPTGRIINYVDDEEYGIRMFWQPPLKEGEEVDPSKVEFLPIGDEEEEEKPESKKENVFAKTLTSLQEKCKVMLENLEKQSEAKKKESDVKLKLIETDIEIAEAEAELKEIIKEMDDELKEMEKEEQKKMEMGLEDDEEKPSEKGKKASGDDGKVIGGEDEVEDEDEDEEDEDEEEDEDMPPSFGSAIKDEDSSVNDQKGKKGGRSSPFAAASLPFASIGLASLVRSQLHQLFVSRKESKLATKPSLSCSSSFTSERRNCVGYKQTFYEGSSLSLSLRARHRVNECVTRSKIGSRFKAKASAEAKAGSLSWPCLAPSEEPSILYLQIPI